MEMAALKWGVLEYSLQNIKCLNLKIKINFNTCMGTSKNGFSSIKTWGGQG